MVSEIDIYRTASLLIKQHGSEALQEAQKRIEAFPDKTSGRLVWQKVAEAIRVLSFTDSNNQAIH